LTLSPNTQETVSDTPRERLCHISWRGGTCIEDCVTLCGLIPGDTLYVFMLGEGNIVPGISSVVAADWLVVAGDSRMFAVDVVVDWSIVATEWIWTVADDLVFIVFVLSVCVFRSVSVCICACACACVCACVCMGVCECTCGRMRVCQ
jgi:hypothetical protein